MKIRLLIMFLILFCLFVSLGFSTLPKDTLTQVSTIDALLAGVYDGHLSYKELLKQFDLVIATTAKGERDSNIKRLAIFPMDLSLPNSTNPLNSLK